MCTEYQQRWFPPPDSRQFPKSSFTNADALATVLGAFATIAGMF